MEDDSRLLDKVKRIFSSDIADADTAQKAILSMVEECQNQDLLHGNTVMLLHNIFEFQEKDAKDIMTHRKNVIAISIEETLKDALMLMLKEGLSRFPVYEEDIDSIIGILHIRDAMWCYLDDSSRELPIGHFKEVIRQAAYIPETKDIDLLFKKMQADKNHMAIVLDEYGQTSGIVTMEDIIEELVGNIQDEYDIEEENIAKIGENTFIVQGMTELNDLEKLLGIEFEHDEYETLNGFLIDQLDRIPSSNEKCVVSYGGYHFHILEIDENIIQKVKIHKVL